MNRTLKLSIMLALATGSGHVLAQNLGPAQVRSTMDQPLVAEIPLTGVSGNTDDIHVALASEEAFSRAGLNREGLPVALSFAVAKNAAGQPVVRVTSSAPVRDTYLDFLVEVGSANNKVIREVTMLLDPPGSTPSAPTASAAPGPRPSRTSDVPARVPSAAEPTPSRAEAAPRPVAEPRPQVAAAPKQHAAAPKAAAAASGQVGPVQRGQTLSSIARENAGGGDLNQVMVALLKANPDAFYRDNINALKTGAVLRIPSPDDIKAQSVAAALTEVRRQNADWRAGTARAPAVVADGAATGAAQGGKNKPAAANDRLALVPSKDGGEAASSRAGTKGGTGDAQVAGLKQDLASSQEAVASLRQQGEELKSRVTDLEAIQSKNERLISLKDAEIAELQRKLGESNKAGGQPVTAAAPAQPASTPAAAPAAASTAKTAQAVAAATPATPASAKAPATPSPAPVAAAPGATKPAATVKPAATPAPVEEDPWYLQPWAWGGGGVAVLLLLLAAVFGRRKKAEPAPVASGFAGDSLADRFPDEPMINGLDGIDPDQREILDALAEHPDDIGLHLELVSLYYGRRDAEHFEGAAEAMFAHVADPEQHEWQEVLAMGRELAPTHPLFGGEPTDEVDEYGHDTYTASSTHHPDDIAALEEFDLGNYVTGPEDTEAAPQPQKHSEYHFNFDLSPVQREEAEHRPNAPDVFDVDAPASPYAEPHPPAATSSFGDLLAEETLREPERPSWSFDDELPPAHSDTTHEGSVAPHTSEPDFDEWKVDELKADVSKAEAPSFDLPKFDEPSFDEPKFHEPNPLDSFSDDPVDTKLDLARAYLDMGDAEGARLMLDEVLAEGSQMQQDTARRILADIV
ncbi:fimbrial protein FimV [Luteibacter anthropi]|uniref:FimV/HubP family polar landmark protein n=1 Tax=Luteibacter anthropi TaxID=564369 RepID=UPI002032AA7C|nr:FimV/HubP family polar landmark protein [Luteibacter anthropi]URX61394.1 fimbrial protein FimV [Luteibacter anthropi]